MLTSCVFWFVFLIAGGHLFWISDNQLYVRSMQSLDQCFTNQLTGQSRILQVLVTWKVRAHWHWIFEPSCGKVQALGFCNGVPRSDMLPQAWTLQYTWQQKALNVQSTVQNLNRHSKITIIYHTEIRYFLYLLQWPRMLSWLIPKRPKCKGHANLQHMAGQ